MADERLAMNVNRINLNTVPGLGRFTPPRQCLREVFSFEVLEIWQRAVPPSENVQFRLKVLEACGPYPSDPIRAAELRRFRAIKAAWDTYLFASFACGMFEGDKGSDLLARLRGTNDDGFRSAMAECMVCWFLAGRMRFPVDPCAAGRNGKNLEMRAHVDGSWIGVEVKAPFRETPKPPPGKNAVVWWGDDADKIDQCMEAANRQFDDNTSNLLVIVPSLRMRVFSHRRDVVKAAFGQSKITCPINTHTGEAAGPTEVRFFPEGKFLNTSRSNGKPLKPDGLPAYRRISAVLCLEERLMERYPEPHPFVLLDKKRRGEIWPVWEEAYRLHLGAGNTMWVEHDVLALHNPNAYHPLSQETWCNFPQLVPVDGEMKWTDGYRVDV